MSLDLFFLRLSHHVPLLAARAVLVGSGIMLWAPLIGSSPATAQDALANEVVLRVGAAVVTRGEFEAQVRRLGLNPATVDEQQARPQAVAVEQMVEERLLKAAIAEDQIVVEKAEIDTSLDRVRAQLAARQIPFADFLKQSGGTEAQLRAQAALEIGVDKMIRQRLTPVALAAAFETRRREFDGTLLRVAHVILRPDIGRGDDAVAECMNRAQGIRNAILQGELGFAAAARRYSAGPSRHQDGDLGYIPRYGVAQEEFAKQVFTLARGDVSKPFATSFGVHIVTVTDIKPGTVGPDVVRQQIERVLAQQVFRDRLAEIRKTTLIEYGAGIPHFARPAEAADPAAAVVVAETVSREGG